MTPTIWQARIHTSDIPQICKNGFPTSILWKIYYLWLDLTPLLKHQLIQRPFRFQTPNNPLPNTIYIKPSLSPNQQYKSTPYKSSSTYNNNTISIRKYYPVKAVVRNKPIHPNNHNPHLFEIIIRSFFLYSISSETTTLRKLLAECIVQTCFKNEYSRQSYRINRPKSAGSDIDLSC